MKILSLEFSSAQRSVALVQGTGVPSQAVLQEAIETGDAPNQPLGMAEQVLRASGLERESVEACVVGLGPGSYTGIRLAIALAQGWQLGRMIRVAGVSSAECIAEQAFADQLLEPIAVVIDAQRGEFYLATYDLTPTGWREVSPLQLASKDVVIECEANKRLIVGPDVLKWFPKGRVIYPRAATLGKLALRSANWIAGEKLQPIYLRPTTFVKAPPIRILPN